MSYPALAGSTPPGARQKPLAPGQSARRSELDSIVNSHHSSFILSGPSVTRRGSGRMESQTLAHPRLILHAHETIILKHVRCGAALAIIDRLLARKITIVHHQLQSHLTRWLQPCYRWSISSPGSTNRDTESCHANPWRHTALQSAVPPGRHSPPPIGHFSPRPSPRRDSVLVASFWATQAPESCFFFLVELPCDYSSTSAPPDPLEDLSPQ